MKCSYVKLRASSAWACTSLRACSCTSTTLLLVKNVAHKEMSRTQHSVSELAERQGPSHHASGIYCKRTKASNQIRLVGYEMPTRVIIFTACLCCWTAHTRTWSDCPGVVCSPLRGWFWCEESIALSTDLLKLRISAHNLMTEKGRHLTAFDNSDYACNETEDEKLFFIRSKRRRGKSKSKN